MTILNTRRAFLLPFLALLSFTTVRANESSPAADLLRQSQNKQRVTPFTLVFRVHTNNGKVQFLKSYQYWTTDGEYCARFFEGKDTLQETLESDGSKDYHQTIFKGNQFWVLNIRKRIAFDVLTTANPIADLSRQSELQQEHPKLGNFYDNPEITYTVHTTTLKGHEYRIVTRHISEAQRRLFQQAHMAPTGVINSTICISKQYIPLNLYPTDVQYFIDARGFIMKYRSFDKSLLISETDIAWCQPLLQRPTTLMEVPPRFQVKVVNGDEVENNIFPGF